MSLFKLPAELVELIFDQIVVSRKFGRVLRIRRVNSRSTRVCQSGNGLVIIGLPLNYTLTLLAGLFKHFIDNSIFRLRLLSQFPRPCYFPESTTRFSAQQSLPYLHSYLVYQALREQPIATSPLGRVRLAAQALNGPDSELTRLNSLICLAITAGCSPLLWDPTSEPEDTYLDEYDNAALETDVFVAAAYLGRKDYVAHLIAKDAPCCRNLEGDSFDSPIFGSALRAATVQGDVEMIKLLFLCIPQYRSAGTLPSQVLHYILVDNSDHIDRTNTCNQQAVFNFVLDTILIERSKSGNGEVHSGPLKAALSFASFPNDFERAAALLPPSPYWHIIDYRTQLMKSVEDVKVEMVRYLLNKGVSPNLRAWGSTPIITAITDGNGSIIRLLLDSSADLSYQTRYRNNALMTAVWRGRVAVTNILLDRGVDPNEGYPPPIVLAVFREDLNTFQLLRNHGARLDTPETGGLAMTVADLHGLSSMQDVLVHEGVRRDVNILHSDPSSANQDRIYTILWQGYTRPSGDA